MSTTHHPTIGDAVTFEFVTTSAYALLMIQPEGRLILPTRNQHIRRRGGLYHLRRRLPTPLKDILNRTDFDGSPRWRR